MERRQGDFRGERPTSRARLHDSRMKAIPLVLFGILLTALSWGLYGNVLHTGQHELHGRLKPFICVGVAYFVIAMIVPLILLATQGKLRGDWTPRGVFWSMMAGAVGAFGALGIILAMASGGHPIYVMPLVFGGAPVINTLVSIYTSKNWKHISPMFIAGLMLVVAGAATVLVFQPSSGSSASGPQLRQFPLIFSGIALAMLCWGMYGIFTHWGQHDLGGGRLKPLICVGFAYFLIAIVVPVAVLAAQGSLAGDWSFTGVVWSSAAGAAGAFGALGTILALSSGGKPIYVMPLIFGSAPVVNTLTGILAKNTWSQISEWFLAGLILVAVGAVVVLIFQPRGVRPHGAGHEPKRPQAPELAKEPVASSEE
jgi:uncharacterized protein with PQ loop repeat